MFPSDETLSWAYVWYILKMHDMSLQPISSWKLSKTLLVDVWHQQQNSRSSFTSCSALATPLEAYLVSTYDFVHGAERLGSNVVNRAVVIHHPIKVAQMDDAVSMRSRHKPAHIKARHGGGIPKDREGGVE